MQAPAREFRLLSAREIAQALGGSLATIRSRRADGELRPMRFGDCGWLRFDRNELEQLISGEQR